MQGLLPRYQLRSKNGSLQHLVVPLLLLGSILTLPSLASSKKLQIIENKDLTELESEMKKSISDSFKYYQSLNKQGKLSNLVVFNPKKNPLKFHKFNIQSHIKSLNNDSNKIIYIDSRTDEDITLFCRYIDPDNEEGVKKCQNSEKRKPFLDLTDLKYERRLDLQHLERYSSKKYSWSDKQISKTVKFVKAVKNEGNSLVTLLVYSSYLEVNIQTVDDPLLVKKCEESIVMKARCFLGLFEKWQKENLVEVDRINDRMNYLIFQRMVEVGNQGEVVQDE